MKRIFLTTALVCVLAGAALAAAENFDDVVSVASTAGGSPIVAANINRTMLCMQNVETQIEYCSKGANVPTATVYGFSLAPASGSGKADGGWKCLSGQAAIFAYTCIAASTTGKIARSTAGK